MIVWKITVNFRSASRSNESMSVGEECVKSMCWACLEKIGYVIAILKNRLLLM